MNNLELDDELVGEILNYMEVPWKKPTLRYLNLLIHEYIRRVPWESVSRVIRRHTVTEVENCPRLPAEFWREAMACGFGGTCFESSLAFFSLLSALGYTAYLTINDMGEIRGCHAAIVVLLGEKKYLVDVTIPVHAAVRIDSERVVTRRTGLYNYRIRPMQERIYAVERSPHPHRYAFTLVDVPISLTDYHAAVVDDYSETNGRFLNCVVMVKLVDGKTHRFFSDHQPYRLESFSRQGRTETFLEPANLVKKLSALFHLPGNCIAAAFRFLEQPSLEPEADLLDLSRGFEISNR